MPEDLLVLRRCYLGPNSASGSMRSLNNLTQAGWYYYQIERLTAGKPPQPGLGPLRAMSAHLAKDCARTAAQVRLRTGSLGE